MLWILVMAIKIVAEVMADISQQINKLRDIKQQATDTANGLKDKWTGDDADALQNEMGTNVGPKMEQVISTIDDFNKRIGQAQQRMQQADQQAKGKISELLGVFKGI